MPRVLVADDSAVVRVALVRRFKSAGLDVVEAASVAEAKALDPSQVDIAVLDFDLGDGYGDAIAAHLRAAKPTLPLCFFTSSSNDAHEKAGPFGPIFTKPEEADKAIAWAQAEAQKL
jgi:CheY-like chemotaxis protein